MENLKDRIAVVTGASGGVGKALAHELTRRGALVLLPARIHSNGAMREKAILWLIAIGVS